jgi:hypothetical protein
VAGSAAVTVRRCDNEAVRRVAVVGCSGTGKTRLARRLADLLGVDHVELDSLHHGPGWVASPAAEMRQQIELRYPAGGRWVADGNYTAKGGDLVRARAETVIWLDLPRPQMMRQLDQAVGTWPKAPSWRASGARSAPLGQTTVRVSGSTVASAKELWVAQRLQHGTQRFSEFAPQIDNPGGAIGERHPQSVAAEVLDGADF